MPDCRVCDFGYTSTTCHKCPEMTQNIIVTSVLCVCIVCAIILTLLYPNKLLKLYNHTLLIMFIGVFNGISGRIV